MEVKFHRVSVDPALGVEASAWAKKEFGGGAEGLRWYASGTAKYEGELMIPILWFYFADPTQAEWFALRWAA